MRTFLPVGVVVYDYRRPNPARTFSRMANTRLGLECNVDAERLAAKWQIHPNEAALINRNQMLAEAELDPLDCPRQEKIEPAGIARHRGPTSMKGHPDPAVAMFDSNILPLLPSIEIWSEAS